MGWIAGLALTGLAAGAGVALWRRRNTPARRLLRRARHEAERVALAGKHLIEDAQGYAERAKEPLGRGRDAVVRLTDNGRKRIPVLLSAGAALLGSSIAAARWHRSH
ncbi:MAG TPA: hypothetical protein VGB99_04765 [Acidobacteriota bacterium]